MYNFWAVFIVCLLLNRITCPSNGIKNKSKPSCIITTNRLRQTIFAFFCETNQTKANYFTKTDTAFCLRNYENNFSTHSAYQIDFHNCQFDRLPNIFHSFSNLPHLNVSYTGLRMIQNSDFGYAKNLSVLDASHNQLTEIPWSVFSNLKQLSIIDFRYNNINRIDPFAFDGATNLKEIWLSNNYIEILDRRTFSNLSRLVWINLSDNQIEVLEDDIFNDLTSLKSLFLDDNNLKQLQCQLFSNTLNLEFFSLDKNRLEEFNPSCVKSTKLLTFNISFNRLKNLTLSKNCNDVFALANEIEWIIATEDLPNLTQLLVHSNRIKNVPEFLTHVGKSLESLDVSNSQIGKLNISTFTKFVNLEYLNLRNTNLSNLQYGIFHHQKSLRILDLSYNSLQKINFDMLSLYCKNLEELRLNGNNLTEIDGLNQQNFPNLEKLQIMDNNFDCDYLVKFLHQWKNVSANYLMTDGTHVDGIECHQTTKTVQKIEITEEIGKTIWKYMKWPVVFICSLLCLIAIVYIVKTFVSLRMKKKRIKAAERSVAYTRRRNETQRTETQTITQVIVHSPSGSRIS